MNFSIKLIQTTSCGLASGMVVCCQNIPLNTKESRITQEIRHIKDLIDVWNQGKEYSEKPTDKNQNIENFHKTINAFLSQKDWPNVSGNYSNKKALVAAVTTDWLPDLDDDRYIVFFNRKKIMSSSLIEVDNSSKRAKKSLPVCFSRNIMNLPFNEIEDFCETMNEQKDIRKWRDNTDPDTFYKLKDRSWET